MKNNPENTPDMSVEEEQITTLYEQWHDETLAEFEQLMKNPKPAIQTDEAEALEEDDTSFAESMLMDAYAAIKQSPNRPQRAFREVLGYLSPEEFENPAMCAELYKAAAKLTLQDDLEIQEKFAEQAAKLIRYQYGCTVEEMNVVQMGLDASIQTHAGDGVHMSVENAVDYMLISRENMSKLIDIYENETLPDMS